jgi:hypothetical protein
MWWHNIGKGTDLDTVEILALVGGIAWASGINLYATVFVLGMLFRHDLVLLPASLSVLADPMVLSAAGFMFFTEFIVDKIPGLDSIWDSIHTFIRIPAGAILSMSAVGGYDPAIEMAAFLIGGTLAASTHFTKASTRLMMQSSPEPITNWTASLGEDMMVVLGIWTALTHPWIFITGLLIFIIIVILLLPRLIVLLKQIYHFFKRSLTDTSLEQSK